MDNNYQGKNKNDLSGKREELTVKIRRNKREQLFKENRGSDSQNINIDSVDIFQQLSADKQAIHQQILQILQENNDRVFDTSDLPFLKKLIFSKDIVQIHLGVYGLRKMLSVNVPPIQVCIDADLVTPLIQFMKRSEYPRLQVEAAWTLTNIASGTRVQTQTIIDKGAMRLFVDSLLSSNHDLVEQCIWAIGNISADSTHLRDMLNDSGAVDNMLAVYNTVLKDKDRYANWIWATSNLVRGVPQPDVHQAIKPLEHFASALTLVPSFDVVHDSCWALTNIVMTLNAHDSYQIPEMYYRAGPILTGSQYFPSIQHVLSHSANMVNIQIPLIKLLGNLAYMNNSNTDAMVGAGILKDIYPLFQLDSMQITRDLVWTLSNFASGSSKVIQAIIDYPPLIDRLFQLAKCNVEVVQKEVYWVFANLSRNANLEQIKQLTTKGIVDVYLMQLHLENSCVECLTQTIKAIKRNLSREEQQQQQDFTQAFEEANGWKAIENLQHHKNQAIYQACLKIINKFNKIHEEEF